MHRDLEALLLAGSDLAEELGEDDVAAWLRWLPGADPARRSGLARFALWLGRHSPFRVEELAKATMAFAPEAWLRTCTPAIRTAAGVVIRCDGFRSISGPPSFSRTLVFEPIVAARAIAARDSLVLDPAGEVLLDRPLRGGTEHLLRGDTLNVTFDINVVP